MALFSLLIAILVERLKLLPVGWQFDKLMLRYHKQFWDSKSLSSEVAVAIAVILPSFVVFAVDILISGVFFDLFSLLLWVVVALVCFSHQDLRLVFKKYVQAACRGDVQACYRYASELDCSECIDAVDEQDLGIKVGQSVAWINYRYYGAVALFLVCFGPVGAVLYCSIRFYYDINIKRDLSLPLIDHLQRLFDWLPSRVFSFGYVLSGQFSNGLSAWRKHAFNVHSSAKLVVTETALQAESLPEAGPAPVSVQPTLALLALSKRNFILLLTVVSVLTIFGVVN
ncbi:beta-lactamase regulator AmpE [Shewanella gaetbuli]|uniref:Beta-lactamase regulator AmpE n=1 Tax=Shewanella gaetbuli TaxID=220752 RepID=A0A9X2CHI6_9GAMM|nr:beta-lactamase regulator AmpE [Shewanella gaetbuli]MCL1142067.1 beta-lactamase regulator AmpE [Shewanella gaetbuli]